MQISYQVRAEITTKELMEEDGMEEALQVTKKYYFVANVKSLTKGTVISLSESVTKLGLAHEIILHLAIILGKRKKIRR